MFTLLRTIFTPGGFEPHSVHFVDNPGPMWLMVYANVLIVISYVLIPVALVYIVRKRKDLVFNWVFLLFGLFIFLCGVTHFMHIVVFWYPLYWMEGIINAITGIVSFGAFLAFIPATISALKLTSPELLKETNAKLSDEARKHGQIREKLFQKNLELERAGKDLLDKNYELEIANKLAVDRELEMVRIKEDIARLKSN